MTAIPTRLKNCVNAFQTFSSQLVKIPVFLFKIRNWNIPNNQSGYLVSHHILHTFAVLRIPRKSDFGRSSDSMVTKGEKIKRSMPKPTCLVKDENNIFKQPKRQAYKFFIKKMGTSYSLETTLFHKNQNCVNLKICLQKNKAREQTNIL